MTLFLCSLACLCVWLTMILARGGFWRARQTSDALAPAPPTVVQAVAITAIVPARDEAETIARCLSSLLLQDCAARFDVVIVDDQSSDGTGAIAQATARDMGAQDRITVLRADDPPPGWTGKINAMRFGLAHVEQRAQKPDYIWFTDADIAHDRDVLARLLGCAVAERRAMVSLMARLACESAAEKWLVPAFVYFFQMLYPFAWVNDPRKKTAGAAGGCMLVDREKLAAAGGLDVIRNALIDDCALGAAIKKTGPIWLGLTQNVHSLRPYPRLSDIRAMVTRSAYAQLHYSPWRLLASLTGLSLTFIAPLVLAFHPHPLIGFPALFALLLMLLSYRPMVKYYRLSSWRILSLPFVAALYMAFTVESALAFYRGRGGAWKGRIQADQ